ncbi:NAD(P)-binding protein [Xylariaceae sp. FL0804]|nr:NAD(P)-binding protein [Xylariaceae sp. FL0804]
MAPLGIAIIGGGIFVKEQHIPAALACPGLALKAIWSRSLKTAEETVKLAHGPDGAKVDVYSADSGEGKGYEDILQRSDIGGVVLALPIVDQPAYIKKALAAGKHVLAEKPIAKDVATALDLIEYSKKTSAETGASLAIAENFRFIEGWSYAAAEIKKLGKITGFVVRLNSMMEKSNKYYNTAWRTKPEYQGGFLLDGGVHFTAALRTLLGEEVVTKLNAQTSLVSSHLPPVDSINAVLKTKSGVPGSYIQSVGTQMEAFEYHVACENGWVKAEGSKVVTVRGHGDGAATEDKEFERTSGVREEVQAWAEAIASSGAPNPQQTPELALGDLELMEKMLTSGDQDGAPQQLQFQLAP